MHLGMLIQCVSVRTIDISLAVHCEAVDCCFDWSVLYARFTLADPTPRLASDVVGGKSGQCRSIGTHSHWPNGAMRTFALVGTVKESYLLQLPLEHSGIVHVRLPIGQRRPDPGGLP